MAAAVVPKPCQGVPAPTEKLMLVVPLKMGRRSALLPMFWREGNPPSVFSMRAPGAREEVGGGWRLPMARVEEGERGGVADEVGGGGDGEGVAA